MRLEIAEFAPDSEFALLTDQQIKRALAEPEINPIAGEVHRLTGSYARTWLAQFQAAGAGAVVDTTVTVSGLLTPIERIALDLMAHMAVDAIGEPLTVQHDLSDIDVPGV